MYTYRKEIGEILITKGGDHDFPTQSPQKENPKKKKNFKKSFTSK